MHFVQAMPAGEFWIMKAAGRLGDGEKPCMKEQAYHGADEAGLRLRALARDLETRNLQVELCLPG